MPKFIHFNDDARNKMKSGVETLAKAVKATLGPKGRNVVIERKYSTPTSTKDGVSVAKEIELEDPVENLGAQMVKEVASKTADIAGDGTTTATVLAEAIYVEGLKMLANGSNPVDIKKGIDDAVKVVVENVKSQSTVVGDSIEKIKQIATISANNDAAIGKLISDAMQKVGKDGVITVDESKSTETHLEHVQGMEFDRGFISRHFINDEDNQKVFLENCLVMMTDKKISVMKDILNILEKVAQDARPLLLICEDLEGEALATLVVNCKRGTLRVVAVKAPSFGDRRKEMLKDIAILTGGEVISEEEGLKLDSAELSLLGEANSVTVTDKTTTILSDKGDKNLIASRIAEIKTLMVSANTTFDTENLKKRLAKLSGGVAVLNIGAATDVELKEKKDRVDDALHATRAAVEEGIIPGGGIAYMRCIDALKQMKGENNDHQFGIDIVTKAIQQPLRTIVHNAGLEPSVVINKVMEKSGDYGFNARTEKYEYLLSAGVIDPTKVARVALENAASVAGLMLTTECTIVEKPDNEDKRAMMMPQ